MSSLGNALDALRRRQPEWSPWLTVLEQVQREIMETRWELAVPERTEPRARAPLLAGCAISIEEAAVRRLLERLIDVASRSGTPKMASLKLAQHRDLDAAALFGASIRQSGDAGAASAVAAGTSGEAFQAVMSLVPVPFLHACTRRWRSAIPGDWIDGYCPVCGAWPAFAEVRGIERSRYLRCGRCGSDWYRPLLRCPYCETSDHEQLTTLVPEKSGLTRAIDACRSCRGYVKSFTRLQACPPASVMIEDLESVELDVAALELGYSRRAGTGYPMDVTIVATSAARRFFSWNA